jgi:Domain of unknown function (DUF4131)
VAVAFGAGIAVYFTADHEPMLVAAAPLAIAPCGAAVLLRRQRYFPVLVLIAAVAAGFATATFRTAWIAHSVLTRPLYDVSLSGVVETRDIRERTDRFVLRVTDMALPRGDISLARVRLSVRKGTAPDVGSFVSLKARLMPPLSSLRPGAYDFARDLFSRTSAPPALRWARPPIPCALDPSWPGMVRMTDGAIVLPSRQVVHGCPKCSPARAGVGQLRIVDEVLVLVRRRRRLFPCIEIGVVEVEHRAHSEIRGLVVQPPSHVAIGIAEPLGLAVS